MLWGKARKKERIRVVEKQSLLTPLRSGWTSWEVISQRRLSMSPPGRQQRNLYVQINQLLEQISSRGGTGCWLLREEYSRKHNSSINMEILTR
jgi:hypothetical protein